MNKTALIQAFHQLKAFQFNPQDGFLLASGKKSPYYVDCRIVLAHPHSRHLVAELAFDLLKSLEFTLIGGLEIGAIPLATTISDFAYRAHPPQEWRTFVVRKQPKDHGLGKRIEGSLQPGDRAVVVDDVMTTGGSLLKAADAGRSHGLEITHALVIVDRSEEEDKQHFLQHGLQLLPILTLQELEQ